MKSRDFYTPRKRRWARARTLPDAGGRGFLMRACRLVVYEFTSNLPINLLIKINNMLLTNIL
jgi:hypothetical protein